MQLPSANRHGVQEICKALPNLRTGPMNTFADRVFMSEINHTITVTEVRQSDVVPSPLTTVGPLR